MASACGDHLGVDEPGDRAAKGLLLGGESDHAATLPAKPFGGGLVDAQVESLARDHDAVLGAGGLDRDVVVQHVVQHAGGLACERIAVAAGPGLLERDDVAVGEFPRLLAVDRLLPGAGIDDGAGQPARLAAEDTPGGEAVALGQVGELALVGEEAQVTPDAAAAAERSGAGRVGNEAELLDDDRLRGLLGLDRDVGGVEGPRHALATVPGCPSPRAGQHQLVGDEAAPARAVPAAEGRVGEVRGGCRHPFRQGGGQRAQHCLERAVADDRPRSPAGGRARIQERALRRRHRHRPQSALVHGAERVGQALHGGVGVRARVVDVGVHARGRLRAGALVVDRHAVAGHRDRHRHSQGLGAGPVVVQEVLEGVDAVGDRPDRRPHARLAARDDLLHRDGERVRAVALGQLHQPQLAHPQGAALGAQVAQHLVGGARVGGDDADHAGLLPVLLPDLRRGNAQPLLEVVEDALHALAARAGAADVGVVDDVDDEADQSVGVERRLGDEEVGKVAGAEERIVEQNGVARA